MKKILFILPLLLVINLFPADKINVNLKNMPLEKLVKVVSQNINKNILYNDKLVGKVNFIANKEIDSKTLYEIFLNSLENIGKTIVEKENYLLIKDIEKVKESKQIKIVEVLNSEVIEVKALLEKLINGKKFFSNKIKPVLTYDEKSNEVIIAGNKNDVAYLENIIKAIDLPKKQVYVKVKIIEISETKAKELGVEYGLKGFSKYSSTSLGAFSSSLNSLENEAIDLAQLTSFGFDLTSMTKAISLGATINFLKQNEALNVVSEPSILCLNNKISSIYVGETKSFKSGQTTNDSGTTESFKREDIGLKLTVKPRVSNNKVVLKITSVLEDAKESSSSTNVDTSKKEIITTAILNNAETVVIGGLIKSKSLKTQSKVPVLGDLPLLGNFFKNEKYINDKIDLAVVITPYIVNPNESLSEVKRRIDKLTLLESKYLKKMLSEVKNN